MGCGLAVLNVQNSRVEDIRCSFGFNIVPSWFPNVLSMTAFDPDAVFRKLTSRLKMRHLMLLLQIEQHGSLTRVAEHMATSQPAVTNALAELESMFGVPLFD